MNPRVCAWLSLCLFSLIRSSAAGEPEWKELNRQIAALHAEGKYGEAAQVAEKSLKMAQDTYGEGHLNVAKSLNNLANLYLLQGKDRSEQAAELYRKTIAIEEKQLGKDHPDVADTLFNLALLYTLTEQYGQALPLLERSLTIKETKLGRDHPDALRVRKVWEELKARGRV